jgi:hypothetical protein
MTKSLLTLLIILSAAMASFAQQDTIFDGGFEKWHGGFFSPGQPPHGVQCCGIALGIPTQWGIPEQLMGMPTDQFVYREEDTAFLHSGAYCAKLYTNITYKDSAGDVPHNQLVLVPGTVTCAGIVGLGSVGIEGDLYKTILHSTGLPYADTPRALNFYMMMSHDVPDTALYAYVFTRWDSVNHREDTLAFRQADLPDADAPMNAWKLYTDTIHYLLPGLPDTLHMIFYGGRNGDSTRFANTTWLDDLSFYHVAGPNTGIVHLGLDDAISLYPNPASSSIHLRVDDYMVGYTLELYDMTGSRLMHETIVVPESSYSATAFAEGVYLYRILDRGARQVKDGKLTVAK